MRLFVAGIVLAGLCLSGRVQSAEPADGAMQRWPYFAEVQLPNAAGEDAAKSRTYCDFVLTPAVFDQAREDLGDLRLYDAAGNEVPYALRVRRPVDSLVEIPARQFNRAVSGEQSSELTLDLGDEAVEHSQLEVQTPGVNYRRAAELEGSADGQTWRKLLDKNLAYFKTGAKEYKDIQLDYPPSRFRYLRLRVHRDPAVDKKPVEIGEVKVRRTVRVPGELVTLPAELGPREAVKAGAGPGSGWIVDLGAAHVPCETLLVDVADREFSRDFTIESGGAKGSNQAFSWVGGGQWSRRAGDRLKPMDATFGEQWAGRLRLLVTDFSNPPLEVRGAQYVSPARQIVFERKPTIQGPLRLYFGNPQAELPHYDVERNLPALLDPAPQRLTLLKSQANPDYVPEPKPLSERWPWAIYVVLGAAVAALAATLLNLSRTAIALHDATQPREKAPSC